MRMQMWGKMSLNNLMIGNPYTSPVNQRTTTYKLGKALTIVDDYNMDQIAALKRRCEIAVSANVSTAGDLCTDTLDYVLAVGGNVFDKDARFFDYDYEAGAFKYPYQDYFNKSARLQDIFQAIHISGSTKIPVFEPASARVGAAFDADAMIDYSSYLDYSVGILSPNILIYAGQWDNRDGPITIEQWLMKTWNFNGDSDLYARDRQIYYTNNGQGNIETGGYFRRSPNNKFTFMNVVKAGHYVPTNNLPVTKSMLYDMIYNESLQCHGDNKDYKCATKDLTCSYMNYCNGNGFCSNDTGECICDSNWAGADCGKRIYALTDYSNRVWNIQGAQYTYLAFEETLYYNEKFELTLTSNNQPMSIYLNQGTIYQM